MKSYNFVKYEFHDSKTFGFYIFSNYKKSNGKRVKYLDINGEPGIIKWIDPVAMLDLDNEGHALMDEFLKGHPAVRSNEWTRVDLKAQERRETTDTLDSARAVIQAAKMTDKEVIQFATLKRMNLHSDLDVLRAKIITIAQNGPESFMETFFDPEKDLRVFIVDAVREKKLNYKNSTYYYGKEAIGTNEEQVLVWLKDNKDILAILKHELRGDKEPTKKTSKA